jgi:hypothetical protein
VPRQFVSERVITLAAVVATAVVAVTIIILSLAPLPAVFASGSDIEHHMLAYAAMVLPLSSVRARNAPLIFVAALALGGAIELMQPFVGRYAEWHDFFANVSGATIGIVVGLCLSVLYRRYVTTNL